MSNTISSYIIFWCTKKHPRSGQLVDHWDMRPNLEEAQEYLARLKDELGDKIFCYGTARLVEEEDD
jgi:hypothetical protein